MTTSKPTTTVVVAAMAIILLMVATSSTVITQVAAADMVYSIHGSGTNNPKNCFWRIMDKLQFQAKLPIRFSYRGIGSGSGIAEFLSTGAGRVIDFASADVPLPRTAYDEITSREDVIQLPVVLGAVAFFHNVPNTPNLNLTACLIAKIYKGEITEWDDPEVLKENPSLSLPAGGLAIKPFHRSDGSSSTSAITGYLAAGCPSIWPAEDVGTALSTWNADIVEPVQGSNAMHNAILETDGTIGYTASGDGHALLLQEPIITNQYGTRLTSDESYWLGGISKAASADALADSPEDFFPITQFINQPGEFVWPMVLMTYIYVKKDITYIENPIEQGLLKAFLQSLYMGEYIQQCEDDYEFSRVDGPALQLAMEGINSLITSPGTPTFVFETSSTQEIVGASNYTISTKRNSIADVERGFLVAELKQLEEEVTYLRESLERSNLESDATKFKISKLEAAIAGSGVGDTRYSYVAVTSIVGAVSVLLTVPYMFF